MGPEKKFQIVRQPLACGRDTPTAEKSLLVETGYKVVLTSFRVSGTANTAWQKAL